MNHEFFNPPRVQPYDPPPYPVGELTVNVEWQRADRDNWTLGVVETERTGRVRIVIEGEAERVRPYLEAVQRIASNTDSIPKEGA